MTIHKKLVRDRIPEIIAADGRSPVTRALGEDEFFSALKAKLEEEVAEFLESETTEELADILEVVYALAAQLGSSSSALDALRQAKRSERGGFARRVFLEEVHDD